MLKKMRKKAGALLVMICLGVIILLCWEAGEHLKDKILRSLETAAEARTGKQTVVLDSGHGGSDSGKVGINGAAEFLHSGSLQGQNDCIDCSWYWGRLQWKI